MRNLALTFWFIESSWQAWPPVQVRPIGQTEGFSYWSQLIHLQINAMPEHSGFTIMVSGDGEEVDECSTETAGIPGVLLQMQLNTFVK